MIRLIVRAILVLTPIIVYILWLRYRRQLAKTKGAAQTEAERAALARVEREMTLAVVALVLVSIACFAALRLQENHANPSKSYVPAQLEDGRIVPGHFK